MSTEIKRMFGTLAADADRAPLPPAAMVRAHADRRARTRTVLALVALVVAVGGTAVGGRLLVGGAPQIHPAPAGSAPVTVPGPPSGAATPQAIPTAVPGHVFLTVADTNEPAAPPEPVPSTEGLPEVCGEQLLADGSDVGVRRTVHAIFRKPDTPADFVADGAADHTVTVHRGDGADGFLAKLRTAVRGCPREPQGCRHRLLDAPGLGDEAVLAERRCPARSLVAAVRVRDAVAVVWIYGWEEADVDTRYARVLVGRAAQHLADWRR